MSLLQIPLSLFHVILALTGVFSTLLNVLQTINGGLCFFTVITFNSKVTQSDFASVFAPLEGESRVTSIADMCGENSSGLKLTQTCSLNNDSNISCGLKNNKVGRNIYSIDVECDCSSSFTVNSGNYVTVVQLTNTTLTQSVQYTPENVYTKTCTIKQENSSCSLNGVFYVWFSLIYLFLIFLFTLFRISTTFASFDVYAPEKGSRIFSPVKKWMAEKNLISFCRWTGNTALFLPPGCCFYKLSPDESEGENFSDNEPFFYSKSNENVYTFYENGFCKFLISINKYNESGSIECSINDYFTFKLALTRMTEGFPVVEEGNLNHICEFDRMKELIFNRGFILKQEISTSEISFFGQKIKAKLIWDDLRERSFSVLKNDFQRLIKHNWEFFGRFDLGLLIMCLKGVQRNPNNVGNSEWKMYLSDVHKHIITNSGKVVKKYNESKSLKKVDKEMLLELNKLNGNKELQGIIFFDNGVVECDDFKSCLNEIVSDLEPTELDTENSIPEFYKVNNLGPKNDLVTIVDNSLIFNSDKLEEGLKERNGIFPKKELIDLVSKGALMKFPSNTIYPKFYHSESIHEELQNVYCCGKKEIILSPIQNIAMNCVCIEEFQEVESKNEELKELIKTKKFISDSTERLKGMEVELGQNKISKKDFTKEKKSLQSYIKKMKIEENKCLKKNNKRISLNFKNEIPTPNSFYFTKSSLLGLVDIPTECTSCVMTGFSNYFKSNFKEVGQERSRTQNTKKEEGGGETMKVENKEIATGISDELKRYLRERLEEKVSSALERNCLETVLMENEDSLRKILVSFTSKSRKQISINKTVLKGSNRSLTLKTFGIRRKHREQLRSKLGEWKKSPVGLRELEKHNFKCNCNLKICRGFVVKKIVELVKQFGGNYFEFCQSYNKMVNNQNEMVKEFNEHVLST